MFFFTLQQAIQSLLYKLQLLNKTKNLFIFSIGTVIYVLLFSYLFNNNSKSNILINIIRSLFFIILAFDCILTKIIYKNYYDNVNKIESYKEKLSNNNIKQNIKKKTKNKKKRKQTYDSKPVEKKI